MVLALGIFLNAPLEGVCLPSSILPLLKIAYFVYSFPAGKGDNGLALPSCITLLQPTFSRCPKAPSNLLRPVFASLFFFSSHTPPYFQLEDQEPSWDVIHFFSQKAPWRSEWTSAAFLRPSKALKRSLVRMERRNFWPQRSRMRSSYFHEA